MKGFSVVELIVGIAMVSIAIVILILSVNQAILSFAKSSGALQDWSAFFCQVSLNFSGKETGTFVNTLDKVLGYSATGHYAFFKFIDVRSVEGGYVYTLKDQSF